MCLYFIQVLYKSMYSSTSHPIPSQLTRTEILFGRKQADRLQECLVWQPCLLAVGEGYLMMVQAGDGEGERRAVIEGVEAGSQLPHLAFMCVDEVGRPAEAGLTGKVQVSWSRGTKKVRLGQEPLQLPDIQVSSGSAGLVHIAVWRSTKAWEGKGLSWFRCRSRWRQRQPSGCASQGLESSRWS